jgi:hypothetical protein
MQCRNTPPTPLYGGRPVGVLSLESILPRRPDLGSPGKATGAIFQGRGQIPQVAQIDSPLVTTEDLRRSPMGCFWGAL